MNKLFQRLHQITLKPKLFNLLNKYYQSQLMRQPEPIKQYQQVETPQKKLVIPGPALNDFAFEKEQANRSLKLMKKSFTTQGRY